MTEAETIDALKRIQEIELDAQEPAAVSFGDSDRSEWEDAKSDLTRALEGFADTVRTFVRVEDSAVGIVRMEWTGDVQCIWNSRSTKSARTGHLKRFDEEFIVRIRQGRTLAAAVRAAITISTAAATHITYLSAVRAAWELASALDELRKVTK